MSVRLAREIRDLAAQDSSNAHREKPQRLRGAQRLKSKRKPKRYLKSTLLWIFTKPRCEAN